MGSMSSPSQAISRLNFRPLPTTPVGARVIVVGDVILARGSGGALYTNCKPLNRKVHCGGAWHWSDNLIEALDQLGVLTKEDRERHERWVADKRKRAEAVEALCNAVDAAKTPGVVRSGAIKRMWNRLDWYGQYEFTRFGHRDPPAGCEMKPQPQAKP